MTEHYTRNTESITKWCNHCNRPTDHIVSDGRVGRCMEHEARTLSKKQEENREKIARGEGLGRNFKVQFLKCSQAEIADCGSPDCAGCYEVGEGVKIHPPKSAA